VAAGRGLAFLGRFLRAVEGRRKGGEREEERKEERKDVVRST
jgi:hypothetical protein